MPISTIAYQTPEYLKSCLDKLIAARKISFYAFVFHFKEVELLESKDHIHLYIEPCTKLDTLDLDSELVQLVPGSRPLGNLKRWQINNLGCDVDWCLYTMHNEEYCKFKGYQADRKYHYSLDQYVTSDVDTLYDMYRRGMTESKFCNHKDTIQGIKTAKNPQVFLKDLILSGRVTTTAASGLRSMALAVKEGIYLEGGEQNEK